MNRNRRKASTKSNEHCHSAFTLIELLVVIAVISMLLSIMLPALSKARVASKRSACISHIKNLATACRVYEADDPQGWSIPVHRLQFAQDPKNPTFIGAYEWGGKSGIGQPGYTSGPGGAYNFLTSRYGTRAGFGPASRPLNPILYAKGFTDHNTAAGPTLKLNGCESDTKLDLDAFRCPADDGPPRGAHCADWVSKPDRSSFDHFGTSYASNVFMVARASGGEMYSNSPYLRPASRIPTPTRTLLLEENIGRWAWASRRESCQHAGLGVDPGPTRALAGWHGADWTYNRAFADGHAEYQKVYIEGTEDADGYALHYNSEHLAEYPRWPDPPTNGDYTTYSCIIVRGPGWQKDTLPAELLRTGLEHPGVGRPSYEDCVENQP